MKGGRFYRSASFLVLVVALLVGVFAAFYHKRFSYWFYSQVIEELSDVYGDGFSELDINFEDLGFTLGSSGLGFGLNGVAITLPSAGTRVDVQSIVLNLRLFSSGYLDSIVVKGVEVASVGQVESGDSDWVPLLFGTMQSVIRTVDFDVALHDVAWQDRGIAFDKLVFWGSKPDKSFCVRTKSGAELRAVIEGDSDLRVALSRWVVNAGSEVGSLVLDSDFLLRPVVTESGTAFAISDFDWQSLDRGKAKIIFDVDGVHATDIEFEDIGLSGEALYDYKTGQADLRLKLDRSAFLDCLKLWPNALYPEIKAWMLGNVLQGVIDGALANLSYRDGNFTTEFKADFHSLLIDAGSGSQAGFELNGGVFFDNGGLRVAVSSGTYGDIILQEGNISFAYGKDHEFITHYAGKARSTLEGLCSILEVKLPKNELDALVEGSFSVTFAGGKMTESKLKGKMQHLKVEGIGFESDDMSLSYDGDKLEVEGEGKIGDNKLFVKLLDFSESGLRFMCHSEFDASKLDKKLAGFLGGKVKADFYFDYSPRDGTATAEGSLDLANAEMSFGYLHWSNSPDKNAKLKFLVEHKGGKQSNIKRFVITAKGLSVEGYGSLTDKQIDVNCSRVLIGENDFALQYKRFSSEVNDGVDELVHLDGKKLVLNLDIKPGFVGKRLIRGSVKELLASNGVVLRDVTFKADSWRGESFVYGKFHNNKDLVLVYGEKGLDVMSQDAGLFLEGLDITRSLSGGELLFRIDPLVEHNYYAEGSLYMDNFALVGAPPLAQILSVASLQDIATMLRGEGIAFNSLKAPFKYDGSSINFQESWLEGNSLGISFQGSFDIRSKQYDFKGEIVPFYTINKIFSDIPILGTVLSGGAGKGVFSVDYTIKSQTGVQNLNVNILSMFAPKVFKLFAQAGEQSGYGLGGDGGGGAPNRAGDGGSGDQRPSTFEGRIH